MFSYNNLLTQQNTYESRIAKAAVLERWDTDLFEDTIILLSYNPISRQIDLSRSLNQHLSKQHPQLFACDIYYFNLPSKCYQHIGLYPFQTQIYIRYQDIQSQPLHFRIEPVDVDREREYEMGEGVGDSISKSYHKFNPKERTIHDVLMKVAEWRKINKVDKVSFEVAAQQVGLSRKTLDDYYLQIKLAETYGFDFQSHEYHGIGVLRRFVKERHVKKKAGSVKILDEYRDEKIKKEENGGEGIQEGLKEGKKQKNGKGKQKKIKVEHLEGEEKEEGQ